MGWSHTREEQVDCEFETDNPIVRRWFVCSRIRAEEYRSNLVTIGCSRSVAGRIQPGGEVRMMWCAFPAPPGRLRVGLGLGLGLGVV
jgi:hypothetical protein